MATVLNYNGVWPPTPESVTFTEHAADFFEKAAQELRDAVDPDERSELTQRHFTHISHIGKLIGSQMQAVVPDQASEINKQLTASIPSRTIAGWFDEAYYMGRNLVIFAQEGR